MIGLIFQLIGGSLVAAGLVLLVTPIPVGAIMVITGVSMLTPYNPAAQGLVRHLRVRFPRFDRSMKSFRKWGPGFVRMAVFKTRPKKSLLVGTKWGADQQNGGA